MSKYIKIQDLLWSFTLQKLLFTLTWLFSWVPVEKKSIKNSFNFQKYIVIQHKTVPECCIKMSKSYFNLLWVHLQKRTFWNNCMSQKQNSKVPLGSEIIRDKKLHLLICLATFFLLSKCFLSVYNVQKCGFRRIGSTIWHFGCCMSHHHHWLSDMIFWN